MVPIKWEFGEAFTDWAEVTFAVGTRKYPDQWATVDLGDWPKVRGTKWRVKKQLHLLYVFDAGSKETVYLHRFLTDFEWPVVDHIDGNGLNNRRSNLRRCESNRENLIHGADRRRGMPLADALLTKWMERHWPTGTN